MKPLFPGRTPTKPTLAGAMARIGDGEGLTEAGGDTMLSSPIGTTQDGPRMTSPHFGSKKAAPFVKGGGRSKTHPNDAKGKKRAAAKAAFAKSKGKDYSVEADSIDLGMFGGHNSFDPKEPRGTNGRWIKAAMKAAHAGDLKALKHIQGQVGAEWEANPTPAMYRERNAVLGLRADAMEAARLTKKASKHAVKKHRAKEAAKSGLSLSAEGTDDIDLGLFHHDVSKEARDHRGQWASIAEPSKAQGAFLKARNDLAQARLEGSTRKIAKAKTEVGKAKWKWDQEQNGKAAANRAAAYYAEQATARVLAENHTRQERVIPPEAPQTPGAVSAWEMKRKKAKASALEARTMGDGRAARKAYSKMLTIDGL